MRGKMIQTPIAVAGLRNAGKTTIICALLKLLGEKGKKGAALKPFDTGIIRRNALEQLSDGEIFCQNMEGQPMETLVSPYIAHEDYPIEMSFRRDGIRVNWGTIKERIRILEELYDQVLIETPDSLFAPITEEKMTHDWLVELNARILWILHPKETSFLHNFAELKQLQSTGLNFSVILNNASQITNQDFLFYAWEKTESFLGRQAEGMVPFVSDKENLFEKLAPKVRENLSGLIQEIL